MGEGLLLYRPFSTKPLHERLHRLYTGGFIPTRSRHLAGGGMLRAEGYGAGSTMGCQPRSPEGESVRRRGKGRRSMLASGMGNLNGDRRSLFFDEFDNRARSASPCASFQILRSSGEIRPSELVAAASTMMMRLRRVTLRNFQGVTQIPRLMLEAGLDVSHDGYARGDLALGCVIF